MRILMTVDAVGGVWSYALTLCESLQPYGIEVTLATLGPRPSEGQQLAAAKLGNVRLFAADYRLEWMPEGWRDQHAAGRWLMQLADAEAADVVHLNGYSQAAMSWYRPTVCVAHSCVASWWRAVHGVPPPSQWAAYLRGVERGFNGADHVVAPTSAFLAQLRSCYDVQRPAQVIRNGIVNRFDKVLQRARLPIVFACGRPWDAAKNMAVLDAAAANLSWRVYLAGELAGPSGTCFSCSSLQALGSLPSDDVMSWLRRASIFVHPALYEPFGLAVAEAAASGCALVLADIPTLRELWDGAAEFFDPRDAHHLTATLDALIADSTRRYELSIAARERASIYSAHTMAENYRQLYENSLHGACSEWTRRQPIREAFDAFQGAQA